MRSWDDLSEQPRFHWREPDPGVVTCASRWRAEGRHKVYDLGCGAGRHLAYLSADDFEAYGTDVAPKGLAACRHYLDELGLKARLVQADMIAAPFADDTFEAAVSTNVLNHGSRARLQLAVDELFRVLRPGAEAFLTVLNTRDWRHGNGAQIEPDSFVLADGPEAGILHHFFSESDLRDWLKAFEILHLERERGELKLSTRPDNRPVIRDGWAVLLRKP